MTRTVAVPLDALAAHAAGSASLTGQPKCPACVTGYLHPYSVMIDLPTADGWPAGLAAWVAVCRGDSDHRYAKAKLLEQDPDDASASATTSVDDGPIHPPCGFSMPMTVLSGR